MEATYQPKPVNLLFVFSKHIESNSVCLCSFSAELPHEGSEPTIQVMKGSRCISYTILQKLDVVNNTILSREM